MAQSSARTKVASFVRAILRRIVTTETGGRALERLTHEISGALALRGSVQADQGYRQAENATVEASRAARDRWHTSEKPRTYASGDRSVLPRLNTVCWLEDWNNPTLVRAMRHELPYYVDDYPEFPHGFEHRKHWEYVQVVVGLEQLGAIQPGAVALSVGAGHEEALYDLSTRVRWLFATDIYGAGEFSAHEAEARMLIDPDHFARCPYNRNRLVVQHMDALDLRFEDETFDAIYSLSSIEHFGGLSGARQALIEMRRVLKPGGIAGITTECIVNDAADYSETALSLFTPNTLRDLFWSVPGMAPVEEPVFSLSADTKALVPISLHKSSEDARRRRHVDYPHVLLELAGRVYTSFSVFLRRHERSG